MAGLPRRRDPSAPGLRRVFSPSSPKPTPPKRCEGGQARAMTRRRHYVCSNWPASSMNYRHAFHAGGFADVIKHIVLVRMLTYLQEKPAAFRVIDTHAGAGRYDLSGEEARRGGEWLTGIARVMQARFSENALPLVTPYLDIVRAFNPPGRTQGLSRIAVDRPRAAAAAGPACSLRNRAECPQAIDRCAPPRHPGAGGRPRWMDRPAGFRSAERAARPGPDRSVFRTKGRV